jgi:hypothetical protein
MTIGTGTQDLKSSIESSLQRVFKVEASTDGLRVTTSCIYPSGGLVRVIVRSGRESLVVSDEGEAVGEAFSAGIEVHSVDRLLTKFVKLRGLSISKGVIQSGEIPIHEASIAIAQVANVAKDAASYLYEKGGIKKKRDFKYQISRFLEDNFRDRLAQDKLLGASHKLHKFENVVSFSNGKKLIIDTVLHDASSINSRVVANLDVRSLQDPLVEQRIIFDDAELWPSADLALLQVGATLIPFSRHREAITRLANEIALQAA